jgi:ankyrin repeat protein
VLSPLFRFIRTLCVCLALLPVVESARAQKAVADIESLLTAAIQADALETVDETQPEILAPDRLYNIDLFNQLLGQPRQEPARDHNGKTALMYAAEHDRFEVLRTLLPLSRKNGFQSLYRQPDAKGRKYIDWCDKHGYTALMYASAAGSVDAVNYLLNAGADMETRCEVAQFDALQLAQSAKQNRDMVVSALERKLNYKPRWIQLLEGDWGPWVVGCIGALVTAFIFLLKFWIRFRKELDKIKQGRAKA